MAPSPSRRAPFSQALPGPKIPRQVTFIESFNGTVRRECLSLHWFLNLAELQQTLNAWREDYNHHRPHSSLADVPAAEFRAGGASIPDRSRLQFARGWWTRFREDCPRRKRSTVVGPGKGSRTSTSRRSVGPWYNTSRLLEPIGYGSTPLLRGAPHLARGVTVPL